MGDRCYLEITLRRSDLDRFGKHLDAAPGEAWWDHLDEEANQPGIVTASVYEANYSWYDERCAAAKKGIDFHGWHAEGGEYGVCVFDDGRQCEEWALFRDKRCVAPKAAE